MRMIFVIYSLFIWDFCLATSSISLSPNNEIKLSVHLSYIEKLLELHLARNKHISNIFQVISSVSNFSNVPMHFIEPTNKASIVSRLKDGIPKKGTNIEYCMHINHYQSGQDFMQKVIKPICTNAGTLFTSFIAARKMLVSNSMSSFLTLGTTKNSLLTFTEEQLQSAAEEYLNIWFPEMCSYSLYMPVKSHIKELFIKERTFLCYGDRMLLYNFDQKNSNGELEKHPNVVLRSPVYGYVVQLVAKAGMAMDTKSAFAIISIINEPPCICTVDSKSKVFYPAYTDMELLPIWRANQCHGLRLTVDERTDPGRFSKIISHLMVLEVKYGVRVFKNFFFPKCYLKLISSSPDAPYVWNQDITEGHLYKGTPEKPITYRYIFSQVSDRDYASISEKLDHPFCILDMVKLLTWKVGIQGQLVGMLLGFQKDDSSTKKDPHFEAFLEEREWGLKLRTSDLGLHLALYQLPHLLNVRKVPNGIMIRTVYPWQIVLPEALLGFSSYGRPIYSLEKSMNGKPWLKAALFVTNNTLLEPLTNDQI